MANAESDSRRRVAKRPFRVAYVIGLLAAAGAALGFLLTLPSPALPRWTLAGFVAVITGAGAWLAAREIARLHQQRDLVEQARANAQVIEKAWLAYRGPQTAIKDKIVNAANEGDEHKLGIHKAKLVESVLASGGNERFPDNARVTYFELADNGDGLRRLICDSYSGGSDPFIRKFVENKGVPGYYVFAEIFDAKSAVVDPKIDWGGSVAVGSIILCAVFLGSRSLGF